MKNFLTARWQKLIMANYAIDPAILQPFLPKHTEIDLFEGKAYVSLVGFMFLKTKIFGVPIPFLGNFEEVNLRFYVKRKVGNSTRRGVVFINETVPYKIVALIANWLYKEHYVAVPTKHEWQKNDETQGVNYYWKQAKKWQFIKLNANLNPKPMTKGSVEEFIFEHYYGYTKIDETQTEEYKIQHPSWQTYIVNNYEIACDFENMYGKAFAHLTNETPLSVMLAEGSNIAVKWKRERLR